MGHNLAKYVQEEVCYTAEQFIEILAEQIPGRSAGERFVMATKVVKPGVMVMEMDDGCVFEMTCRKLK